MTVGGRDYGEPLRRLVSKFSEDFDYEYDSERAAFDEFDQHSVGDPRRAALSALDALLRDADDDPDLAQALATHGLNYVATEAGHASYRDFALMLRGWLVESLAERPDGAEG